MSHINDEGRVVVVVAAAAVVVVVTVVVAVVVIIAVELIVVGFVGWSISHRDIEVIDTAICAITTGYTHQLFLEFAIRPCLYGGSPLISDNLTWRLEIECVTWW